MVLLLARTHYSLLTAPASPRALCEEAVRCGLSHLVLADSNGLYGLWPFAREAARVGLHAVFGCELVVPDGRLVAIARDRAGYRSLCALLSERHGVGGEVPFALARACERHAAGLWFLCSDVRLLPELSVRVGPDQLLVALPGRTGVAAPAVVLDAPRDPSRGDCSRADRKLPDPAPPVARQQLVDVARDLALRLCAVHDVWFPSPQDHTLHQFCLAVKWNRGLRGDAAADLRGIVQAGPWAHLPAKRAQHAGHDDQPEAIAVAEQVLASCTLAFPERAPPIFPPLELPPDTTAGQLLQRRVQQGLRQRYGDRPDAAVTNRCAHELAVIERMGFAPYFLAVDQIAALARERDIPCLGRGSAADSLVAYCLHLTDADPIRYGLLFERFLNPGRSDLPDIDLDFCWRRRDELIDAVYEHFGRDHVARIATYNTCGPRAAYQEAAKVFGLPVAEAARRSQLLPWHAGPGLDLAAAAAAAPGFWGRSAGRGRAAAGDVLPPEQERRVLAAAQRLLEAPRHLGIHPGGVVVTPEPIATHAPLERAAKGVVVTQYDMHFVEGLGMVKIDLLGNRALTIVHDGTAMLRRHGVVVPDLQHIAEDDARTAALVQHGGTLGCFQVESPAMRTLLQQLGTATQERVIQAIALVRPGPAASGMKEAFVRRARGLEPVTAAHPLLAEVFADTFGIMLYQEDVIRAAMVVAGVDATAGDGLRRELGKAGRGDFDAFLVAGLRRGLPRPAIEQVWAEMARFAAYSFCKAHAVSYGRLAWRCVFLKARWPAAFLAALLRNDAGYFAPGVYAEEAKRLGVTLHAPCVQHGQAEHELLPGRDGDGGAIRIGLLHVQGLSARTVQAIATARAAGGAFRSFADFLQRVRPARDEAAALIEVGACAVFGASRPELLWRLQVASSPQGQRVQAQVAAAAHGALFAEAVQPREVQYPALADYDTARTAAAELRLLGFTLGSHPVDVLWRRGELPVLAHCVPCGRVAEHTGATIRVCGFAVAFRGHRSEQGGMCFVTLEDGTGIVEATLFPAVWQRVGALLQGRGPYVVRGAVEERLGGVGLRVVDVALAVP